MINLIACCSERAIVEALAAVPFWYLRHGETEWNARNLTQGRSDIPLNAHGIAQAYAAADKLAGRGIETIVASPLGRVRETARIVGGALGLGYETDDGLMEAYFGEEDGKPIGAWYDAWVRDAYTPTGGETFAALRERALGAFNRALARPGPVLVVAHGGLFRAARALMGLDPTVRTSNGAPLHCEPGAPWSLTEPT